ncbi:MAG: zf-TFIIB domain-containing protein [Elusimicrobia bacterium]|nr:zf-TFIIB domain-containing protein [Elusimicrobiota bacterium]
MNCPKCRAGKLQDLKLKTKQAKTLELEQCNMCGGVWFDRGELEDYLGGTVTVIDFPKLDAALAVELDYREAKCPRCDAKLSKSKAPQNDRIQGDACKLCGGLWLDGGEADGIKMADKVNAVFDDWLAKLKPAKP